MMPQSLSDYIFQLQCDWAVVQVIQLRNDGAGFGFGISGEATTLFTQLYKLRRLTTQIPALDSYIYWLLLYTFYTK
jgi:hypothetical protein